MLPVGRCQSESRFEAFVSSADAALVQRCIEGDEAAVRAFVQRFQGRIFGLCYRMLGHREDAEDVTQEIFLRVFRNLWRWDARRSLVPWLMTIAVNRCRTALKQRSRLPAVSDIVEATQCRASSEDGELGEELQCALQQLREDYRTCFVLFYQQELPCTEIGEILNCPTGTVKTWLHRARRELADILRRRGVVHHDPSQLQRV